MASSYGRKKTFKEKANAFGSKLKRAFIMATIGGAAIGGPAYYHYGTIHEQEVNIKEVKSEYVRYDEDKGAIYTYKIITDKGTVLANENTLLHLKFNSKDIQDMLSEGRDNGYYYSETPEEKKAREAASPANKVYKIRYYGSRIDVPFVHTFPNLLSVREVPQEELQARAKAQAEARRAQQQAQNPNGQQVQPVVQPGAQNNPQGGGQQVATGALSGTMITYETVVNGQKISMTVPIEAADKIIVNKVTPLVPGAAPRGPGM
ncbi:MAG TPA: hypothetical protein VEF76_14805 [Patescibacteria group bacterium]|nr:hypothetical protein [Patescibacteria group bacterium]